jgi:hypothetical protein
MERCLRCGEEREPMIVIEAYNGTKFICFECGERILTNCIKSIQKHSKRLLKLNPIVIGMDDLIHKENILKVEEKEAREMLASNNLEKKYKYIERLMKEVEREE